MISFLNIISKDAKWINIPREILVHVTTLTFLQQWCTLGLVIELFNTFVRNLQIMFFEHSVNLQVLQRNHQQPNMYERFQNSTAFCVFCFRMQGSNLLAQLQPYFRIFLCAFRICLYLHIPILMKSLQSPSVQIRIILVSPKKTLVILLFIH